MQLSTNVSLGSITVIMNELLESGYLLKTNKGKFLKNKQDLLERWVVAYNEILKPKQLIRRMTFKDAELRKNWADLKLPSGIYWGGNLPLTRLMVICILSYLPFMAVLWAIG